jgi:hypothetical protein
VRAIQPLLERQAKQRAKTLADDEFSFPFGAADQRRAALSGSAKS